MRISQNSFVFALSTILSTSLFSCGDKKIEAPVLDGYEIQMPAESSAVSLKSIPEGTYKIVEISTYRVINDDGVEVKSGFKHFMSKPGSPKKGDEFSAAINKVEGYSTFSDMSFNLPMSVTHLGSEVSFNNTRAYSNSNDSSGDRSWYLSAYEDTTRNITDIVKNNDTAPGISKALVNGEIQGVVITVMEGSNLVIYARGDFTNGFGIVRAVYQKGTVESIGLNGRIVRD